ncbi:condensation domain-containing protein, partial [Streptomyces sioyaensis]|uniref:condensation domain-containing protein n=1 Tax=Streptomyces sioyaensis TaxID=67364 RepID=UPI00379BE56E
MNSVHGDTAVGDQLGEQLRGVYAEVLGLPSPAHVSLDDSFFALGGDSLLSIEAVAAAAERGIAITLDQIYRRHSVRGVLHELAASADAPPPNGTPDAAQPAALPDEDLRRLPPDVVDAIPAGALQQGMILHASMYPGSTAYHDVALYHVRAPLDADALRRATARVTAEQPAFRTGFDLATYREPLQLIHRVAEVDVAVHDHLGVDPAERRAALSAWVREEHARPFDIAVPPLARIAVFDEGSSGFVLGISFHHAILDGHSLARFLRMLLSDYHACLQGGEARPANRPTADHGLSVRLERQAESSAEQLGWWRARMRDFTRTALPRTAEDGPQGGVDDEGMGRLEKSLDGALVTRLKEVARDRNVTVKHLALGVHQWVLGQVTGAGDVTSGLIVGVRPEQAGAIDQLGLFLNTVPCRTSVSGTTWVGLAQRALAAEAELLPYRRVPYAAICRTLTPPGEPSEVTFNYVHYRDYGSLEHDTGILLTPLKFHEEANFPLSAYVVESPHGAGLGIVLQYQRVLTGDAAASRMLDLYAEGFAACAASPDAPCPEPPPLAPSTDTGHPAVAEEPGTLRERAAALLGVPDAVLTAVTPAGPTQRDLYLDHLRAPDADTYCLAFTARLGPDLDRAAWERAIAEVTEEHPALRMRCAVLGEHPYLCVLSAEQALEEHAVPGWSTGPVAGAVSRAREPYRIPEDLLVRHDLVCDGGEWHAVLGAHHIALDVAGAHTVLSDVLAVYARLAGTTPPVRPGETTGRPRPRKAARQPDFDTPDTLDHWRETARHVVGVEVPAPSSAADAGSREDAAFAEERATLSGTALSRLRADCARRGVGLSSALISAYALVVGKCFGPSGDFLIHQLLAGPGAAAREVTGARYHVLPTVVPWSRRHRPGFAEELAAELHAGRRALGEHAFVSVLEQRRLLPAEGIRFVYNHYPESALAGPSGVARMEVYESYPEDEVHLIVRDFGTEVELVFRHPVRGFPPLGLPERIARVVTGLRASDEESAPASADSSGGLHALPLLSAQERDHILHRWNPTPTPHTPTTIHDL